MRFQVALYIACVAPFAFACTDNKSNDDKGPTSGMGGTVGSGGSTTDSLGGTLATGGSTSVTATSDVDAGPVRVDGGLVQIGNTDPAGSVTLDDGGYYKSGDQQGYCFTFADGKTNGSTIFPPCGGNGAECFTKDSGLCVTASLGVASGSIWGAGIGCSVNEEQTGGNNEPKLLVGKTSISVEIFGHETPGKLRLQLNNEPPIYEPEPIDQLHSGYYCQDITLSEPDADGVRKGTVQISELIENCWNGTGLSLDLATQTVKSVQLQVNADGSGRTDWDFCVSKLSID